MADGQICCCGSNRLWLMILVVLNILSSIFQLAVIIYAVTHIEEFDWGSDYDAEKIARIVLYVAMGLAIVILAINVMPIFAEVKKRPGLYRPFRNLQIVLLCLEVVGIIGLFVIGAAAVGYIVSMLHALVTAITIVFVIRRIRELNMEVSMAQRQNYPDPSYPPGVY